MTLHVILFTITYPGSGLMALIIAIDRALAVYMPIRYLKFSIKYTILLTILGYSLVIPVLISSFIIVYGTKEYNNFPV